MPSRYRSNESVSVTVSVPSAARPTDTEPGYRALVARDAEETAPEEAIR